MVDADHRFTARSQGLNERWPDRLLAGMALSGDPDDMRTELSAHVRLSLRYKMGKWVGIQLISKIICLLNQRVVMHGWRRGRDCARQVKNQAKSIGS
jgi:hypothetical protein